MSIFARLSRWNVGFYLTLALEYKCTERRVVHFLWSSLNKLIDGFAADSDTAARSLVYSRWKQCIYDVSFQPYLSPSNILWVPMQKLVRTICFFLLPAILFSCTQLENTETASTKIFFSCKIGLFLTYFDSLNPNLSSKLFGNMINWEFQKIK